MNENPFGPLSLLPPLVAIVLAITTRRVVLSLLVGVAMGSILVTDWDLPLALVDLCKTRLWASLIDEDHLRVFAFTLLLGAMIGVIYRCGGMHGIVDRLSRWANNRQHGQLVTWALGMVVFFDDYANTLLLGTTMRPLADRLKISREKLAYIVDSTAAPVAGLALISTWVAVEISLIEKGFAGRPVVEELEDGTMATVAAVDGMTLFIASIPYRFYVLWALLLVVLVAWLRRDFGPMLAAERRTLRGENPEHDDLLDSDDQMSIRADTPRRARNALVPVVVVLAVTVTLLLVIGRVKKGEQASMFTWFTSGDPYVALMYGSLAGLLTAVLLSRGQRILSTNEIGQAALRGALQVAPALAILWLAWSLASVTGEPKNPGELTSLDTAGYLAESIKDQVSVAWMPTIVFLLASAVAFCTGTSWATMGILMTPAIKSTHRLLATDGAMVDINDPLLIATIGSVLAGAIFGDHCSPISDTTVLSSRASGCDHIAHVRTQLPYALLAAAIAVVFGTIPVGFGVSVWPMLALSVVALVACVVILGKRAED
jgi:Na+/H+ antiporter NhaC